MVHGLKPASVIPPVVALILVGIWIVPQRRKMAEAETECVKLRTRIAAASPLAGTVSPTSDPLEKRRRTMEWRKAVPVTARIWNSTIEMPVFSTRSGQGVFVDLSDPRDGIRFRQRMEAMSAGEILAALDEISVIDLPADDRGNLECQLLGYLARKDPKLALDRSVDQAGGGDYRFGYQLSDALTKWAKTDPAAAGDWFDAQIAAGKFDSTRLDGANASRTILESALIETLLSSSPEAAERRLAALPEDHRGDVLSMYSLTEVAEENQAAHARLVRAQVPEAEQAAVIAAQTYHLFKLGDYSAASAYLNRVDATPSERAASVAEAVKWFGFQSIATREDLDRFREWAGTQSPESVDAATGKVLGAAMRSSKFATVADLAAGYSAESGSDEVLAVFLSSDFARRHKGQAREFVGKISDAQRRADIMERLK